jgi:hypothetical protein
MMYRMALPLLAVLVAGGCEGSTEPRRGALNIRKDCSAYAGGAGQTCTITQSNLAEIPVGSTITYASAAVGASLDTDIAIDPPGTNDNAAGHCTLNLATGIGTCTLSGGTGRFSALSASVAVSNVSGAIYAWDGTYSFDN